MIDGKNILVSGNASGLGRYLCERFGAVGLSRDTYAKDFSSICDRHWDLVIHCAFNSARDITSENLASYVSDNVLLTDSLAGLDHDRFVFLSTVDVYSGNDLTHKEDEDISLSDLESTYGVVKLMSESIVRDRCSCPLILRAAALLGKYSRKNSLIRILQDESVELSLSKESSFNYVLHEDVGSFIGKAVSENVTGIYNIASNDNVTLGEVAEVFGKDVVFGEHRYKTGIIDTTKAKALFSALDRSSMDVVRAYADSVMKEA